MNVIRSHMLAVAVILLMYTPPCKMSLEIKQLSRNQNILEKLSEILEKTHGEGLSVELFVKLLSNTHPNLYTLNTKHKLHQITETLKNRSMDIQFIIERQPDIALRFELGRSSLIIPQNFVVKYFASNGEPTLTEMNNNSQLSFCYFTGKALGANFSFISLNLCDKVEGTIEMSEQTFGIKSIVEGHRIKYLLYKHSDRKWNNLMKCGSLNDKHNSRYNFSTDSKYRYRRRVRQPTNYSFNTRYIELYIVVDNSIFSQAGSVDGAVRRAIDIVHYSGALYKRLDIYLSLVGVEIWSDANKITYTQISPRLAVYDAEQILQEFAKYRLDEISTPNDNAQLFVGVKLNYDLDGWAAYNTMCSKAQSVGMTRDDSEPSVAKPAIIMAHEIGHNLGFRHTDVNRDKRCSCRSGAVVSCIMDGAAG